MKPIRFAQTLKIRLPFLTVENILPILKRLRTLKAPCEIDAMRRAMTVTREGILLHDARFAPRHV